jgi:hypothetical protein
MANVAPLTAPGLPIPADPLLSLTIFTSILFPKFLYLQHTITPGALDLLLIYCYPTFSGRQLPTLSKMRFLRSLPSSMGFYGLQVITTTSLYHVRIDQISYQTGDLISRHLFRVPNPGW